MYPLSYLVSRSFKDEAIPQAHEDLRMCDRSAAATFFVVTCTFRSDAELMHHQHDLSASTSFLFKVAERVDADQIAGALLIF